MGAADGAVYSRNTAQVDGVDVAYLRGGRLERYSPVVYLHGMGPSGRWESYHMAMGTVTDIWAPQLPGWAEGEPPEGIGTLEDYARLLGAFLDGAGIGEATLVGHCVGGWLALQLAVQQPERFRRLVLVDALGLAMGGHARSGVGRRWTTRPSRLGSSRGWGSSRRRIRRASARRGRTCGKGRSSCGSRRDVGRC